MKLSIIRGATLCTIALLVACSGGGGGGGTNPVAPSISAQPAAASVNDGAGADFAVTAMGTATLTYQWQRMPAGGSFADISGATAGSYHLATAMLVNEGDQYRVVISNSVGSVTSGAATLHVAPVGPTITTQPVSNVTVMQNSAAGFSVVANGSAPLAYQWQRNGVGIPGAVSSSYNIASAAYPGNNLDVYTVVVSNAVGSVTSTATTLTVTQTIFAPSTVTVSSASGSFTYAEGASVVLNAVVDANATAPLTFQWLKNGVNIAGEVADHLAVGQATAPMEARTYSVRVANSAGAQTATPVTLHVNAGVISLAAGQVGDVGNEDGTGSAATFSFPRGMAVDLSGNSYVADQGNHTVRKITAAGVVTTIAGQAGKQGFTDGAATTVALLNNPKSVAVDSVGNVYVGDQANYAVRKIDVFGGVTTVAGSGSKGTTDNVTGTSASFSGIAGLALIGSSLYLADTDVATNVHRIRLIDLGTPSFPVSTYSGSSAGSADGTLAAATYNLPSAITADASNGVLYVADSQNNTIRKLDTAGGSNAVTTVAGTAGAFGAMDGSAAIATFATPAGLVYTSGGLAHTHAIYVADTAKHTIRKIDLDLPATDSGFVTTFAGTTGSPGANGGSGTAARFNSPYGIGITAAADRLVVANSGSDVIDQIAVGTVLVANLAGRSARGYVNGAADGSLFNFPQGMSADASRKVYVADALNDVVRVVDLAKPMTDAGYVSLLAGGPGQPGTLDGTAIGQARFNTPSSLAIDGSGKIYVADRANDRVRIIDAAAGTVATLADDGSLLNPRGVAVNAAGDTVYVSSLTNHSIYKLNGGITTRIAGSGSSAGAALVDGDIGTARFNSPAGLALFGQLLYVADRETTPCA